jgi:hypothetical protein
VTAVPTTVASGRPTGKKSTAGSSAIPKPKFASGRSAAKKTGVTKDMNKSGVEDTKDTKNSGVASTKDKKKASATAKMPVATAKKRGRTTRAKVFALDEMAKALDENPGLTFRIYMRTSERF